jgi:hypothetical protein
MAEEKASFLSISLDLVGSTALKRAMFEAGHDDFRTINRLYERYVALMFEIEEALYRFTSASGAIDIRRLFLAKIIGDEYWFLYEVDPEDAAEINTVAHAFIFGLLHALAQTRSFHVEGAAADGAPSQDRRFDVSLKGLLDLVTNALHLPDRRFAFFEDKIMDILGSEARLSEVDPGDYAALCYSLNFRPARPVTRDLLGVARSDYVGMQIDRFFRTARACKPRMVTVGESLWRRLDGELTQLEPGIDVYTFGHRPPGGDGHVDVCNASRETLQSWEMPGIEDDYEVHHLYSAATLREEIYRPDHGLADFLGPTRAFLAKAGFYGLDASRLVEAAEAGANVSGEDER